MGEPEKFMQASAAAVASAEDRCAVAKAVSNEARELRKRLTPQGFAAVRPPSAPPASESEPVPSTLPEEREVGGDDDAGDE